MARLRSVLVRAGGVLAILALAAVVAGVFLARRSFPQIDGQVSLPGLDAQVDVYRDNLGIPHIYAETTHDLFFAQGYVHAQDRFWQMDVWRMIGQGRIAEMLGPSQLGADRFLRTLGWARVAEQEMAMLDPESLAILQAYADGVNAYLAERSGSGLSLEYAVLGALTPGYEPEPWLPVHTLVFAKLQAWNLGDGELNGKIERAVLLNSLSAEQLAELIPPYPRDHPLIVTGPAGTARSGESVAADSSLAAFAAPALTRIESRIAMVDEMLGGARLENLGSNSWAVSGELTDTGLPYLANDPHLGAQLPSIWYEIGLHCTPKGPDCPYDVAGFTFASAPGIIIGHNDRIAWAATNLGPDVMDLYIEKINPSDPNQYEFDGEWVDMEMVRETVRAGGETEELVIRYTRHGPIISDTYGDLEDFDTQAGVQVPESYAIALRWTALEPGLTLEAFLGFNKAQNWEDFQEAARSFVVPSQNLLYADVEGNIGYQTPGWIPIRSAGHNPAVPVAGWTGEFEWQGFIPFDELPQAINPPEGYIVTANNAVIGSDYPYPISQVWAYGFRARRIVELLQNAPRPMTIETMKTMQGDNMDLNAETLVPVLLGIEMRDDRLASVQDILKNWDHQSNMDSAQAAIFQVFWKHLLAETFRDDLPEDYWPDGGSRWFEVMRLQVPQPDALWWDDRKTSAVERRDEIFERAFTAAVDELEAAFGRDPAGWSWGALHVLILENQTLGKSGVGPIEAIFNRGPFQTSGGSAIVNATSWSASADSYRVNSLPSMRMIVDLADLSRSLTMHPTGQSGHAYHPHYTDLTDAWRHIEYHAMLWARSDIEAQMEGHLRLVP